MLVVLIVLYIGSQLLSSLLMPSTADHNQRMLMLGLPFVFTFFIISFPAGLIVYWITTNLWTVGQGWIVRRRMGPISVPKAAGAADAVAGGLGGGGTGLGGLGGMLAKLTSGGAANGAPEKGSSKVPAAKGAGKPGAKAAASKGSKEPAATAKPSGPPPRPPRQKKKRSGRRR